MACPEIPQQPQLVCQKATPSDPAGCDGGPGGPTEGDLECLVCREPYSGLRPPKLLGCQHAFCAVCLKLLLCVQDDAWSIPCPLCRKVTAVPGGLVCTLRDQEKVLERLAWPGLEVPLRPQGLANPATLTAGQPREAGEEEQDLVSSCWSSSSSSSCPSSTPASSGGCSASSSPWPCCWLCFSALTPASRAAACPPPGLSSAESGNPARSPPSPEPALTGRSRGSLLPLRPAYHHGEQRKRLCSEPAPLGE